MSDIRSLNDFLALLKAVTREHDGQYKALCPAHNDQNPSLSISLKDSKILLKCMAGCQTEDVVSTLGLTMGDLFLNDNKSPTPKKQVTAIYHYKNAKGEVIFETVRYTPKTFKQRRPDGKGGYIWNLKGVRLVPYHLPELIEAVAANKLIFIAEGENDVDKIRDKLGFDATCNPLGAGKWRDSYSKYLIGADIVIIADKDEPGRVHAQIVAKLLYGKATSIKIVELPGEHVKDASDWIEAGGTKDELEQIVSQTPEWVDTGGNLAQLKRLIQQRSEHELLAGTTLPEIIVTHRQLRDITADVLEALYRANKPERIFRRSGTLTRISWDEKARPFIEALSESASRGYLARCCNFIEINSNGDTHPALPPLTVVRDCLSLGDWQFPPLSGITEAPVIRPNGTVLTEPGYDSVTNLYYFPSPKLSLPPVPDKPTDNDVKAAIKLALEPVGDFPFDSEASWANAIATMFTPILRPMVDGPVPLTLFDKPQQGTGASLLAEVISLISTGRAAAMMTAKKDDAEWHKTITSLLLRGQLVATIDNIEGTLYAPSLAAVLTATTYQDRILGRSEMVTLPCRTIWIGTGNNIKLAGDLPRRCIWVRMDAKMARPWLRDVKSFKHPRLIQWVSENRGAILAAILTIARAWVVAGMPEPVGLPNLGGYESYCRIVGGVLAFMGVSDFLGNLNAMYDETDTETPQWEGFLETWHDIIGDKTLTAAELISYMSDNAELRAALPDAIADTDAKNYTIRLGQKLGKRNGVRYPNGFALVKAGEKKRAVTWKVVRFENKTSPNFSFKGEVGEVQNTPALTGKSKNGDKNNKAVYKREGETTSSNLTLASKKGEVDWREAILGMPIERAIELWRSEGAPVIHLGSGENCLDLGKLLSNPGVLDRHLEAVRTWLEKRTNKLGEPGQ